MAKRSWIVAVCLGAWSVGACSPVAPTTPVARLDIETTVTWCGGIMPPPGEPACTTSSTAAPFEVRQHGELVTTGITGADGHLIIEVPAGPLSVHAAEPPAYMHCDSAFVEAIAGATIPVLQSCTVYAP